MPSIRVKSKGLWYTIKVDEADLPAAIQHTWSVMHVKNSQYAVTGVRADGRRSSLLLHRLLTGAPDGYVVDHINGDGLDNRRVNLRVCTPAQNSLNRGKQSNNAAGFKGVRRSNTVSDRYEARIRVNGVIYPCGSFATAEEAARAYDRAAIELHGEFARTNFPREDYE